MCYLILRLALNRYRRNVVGRRSYPKTVDEMGGLPLFGKEGIPKYFGGIDFWRNNFISLPPQSRFDVIPLCAMLTLSVRYLRCRPFHHISVVRARACLLGRNRYSEKGVPGSKPGAVDTFRILFNNLLQFLVCALAFLHLSPVLR